MWEKIRQVIRDELPTAICFGCAWAVNWLYVHGLLKPIYRTVTEMLGLR